MSGWLVPALLLLHAGAVHAVQQCAPPLSAPDERYEDQRDGTVTDLRLRLTWMRCSAAQRWSGSACVGDAGRLSWQQAQALADEVNQRGTFFFNDWRLPQLRELATLVETGCVAPRINASVFPGTAEGLYWTASLQPGGAAPALAYALGFGQQGVELMDKTESHHVRLVRNAR